jgi:anthranilate/para-aminobenzoate synthase component I
LTAPAGGLTGERGPLGWFGWFRLRARRGLNDVPTSRADTPDAAFLFVDRAIVFDPRARTVRLAVDRGRRRREGARRRRGTRGPCELAAASRRCPRHPADPAVGHSVARPTSSRRAVRWRHDPADTRTSSPMPGRDRARPTPTSSACPNRVDVDVDGRTDGDLPRAARESSPSHHGGYVRFGDVALLSASPELFLHVDADGIVSTKPMKGTRRRGRRSATATTSCAGELLASRQGARREPHDRRPHAQRPGSQSPELGTRHA